MSNIKKSTYEEQEEPRREMRTWNGQRMATLLGSELLEKQEKEDPHEIIAKLLHEVKTEEDDSVKRF